MEISLCVSSNLYVQHVVLVTMLTCRNHWGKMDCWKQIPKDSVFILMQRTKSILRNTAGHLCGTWKRTTTTKEHAKSVTRRTTCTRDGSVNASGSSGTFLPLLTQTLLLLAHLLSSDQAVRPGPLWRTSVSNASWKKALLAMYAPIIQAHSFSSCLFASAVKRHSSRFARSAQSGGKSNEFCSLDF